MKRFLIGALAALILGSSVFVSAAVAAPPMSVCDILNPGHCLVINADGSINLSGTFTGGNPAAGATGSAVPADGDYIAFNSGGNLVGVSSSNPLPVIDAQLHNDMQTAIPAGTNSIGNLNPASQVASSALEAAHVIKASGGNLYSFEVTADSTLSAAPWWIMIFNATSAPADGAVTPAKCYSLGSGQTGFSGAFAAGGVAFSTGITIAVSTSGCFTKASSAHAHISGDFL